MGGLGALVTQSLKAADAIAKTADKVGLTTDQLQELRHAADLTGVKTNTLDMAMQRFSRRLGEAAQGKGELVKTLKQYNIAVADSTGRMRTNVDVLGDLADAIKNAGSDQERLRIAFKAFDSEGAALVNTLKNGRAGLDDFRDGAHRLGLVLDEDAIRASERANDRINDLVKTIQTRFTAVVIENADQIERLADGLLYVVDAAGKAARAIDRLWPTEEQARSHFKERSAFDFLAQSGNPLALLWEHESGTNPAVGEPNVVRKKIYGAPSAPGASGGFDLGGSERGDEKSESRYEGSDRPVAQTGRRAL